MTDDGRSLRAWLYRITGGRCPRYPRGRSRRPRPVPPTGPGTGTPAASDPWWLQPIPDALVEDAPPGPEARYDTRESIALPFVAGLQQLPPGQRAVLVLRDVLGLPAAEVAEILDSTPAAVDSTLVGARAGLRPCGDPGDAPLPGSAAEAAVVTRFVTAFERFDLARLAAVLTCDARLTMPPEPAVLHGPDAISGFFRDLARCGRAVKLARTRANCQPAVAYYLPDPSAPLWRPGGLMVLALRGDRVCGLTRFADAGLFARFALPETLPRDRA